MYAINTPMQNELVFDIETKQSFQDVGGKHNMHLLGVSVVGVYSYTDDTLRCYEEKDFPFLEEAFRNSSRIIGFNSKHFDVPVLQPHVKIPLAFIPHLDLMTDIESYLGFRVSLDGLAKMNLGTQKSGHGMDAIKWWREGNLEMLKKYCLDDVRITRDVYEFGKKNGHIVAETRQDPKVSVPVSWHMPVTSTTVQSSLF